MIYIGHFSFDESASEGDVGHGYLSCVVDTDSAENAVNEFRKHLLILREKNEIFSNIINIYIEDIIGIEKVPSKPIITHLQSSVGQFPKSVSYSLPSVSDQGVEAFGWAPEMNAETVSTGEYKDSMPFLEFE